jgi:lysyl-tRNA synthetase class 2
MIRYILDQLFGTQIVTIRDRDGNPHQVDFGKEWPRVTMAELIKKDANIDLSEVNTAEGLRAAIKAQGIKLDVPNYEQLGYGNLLDVLYKKVSRPKLVEPVFLIKHPVDLSPLARRSDSEPELTDRFQLVVSSWEVVNAYSELVDPVDQKARLEDQARLKSQGDTEAMMMDEPFIEAMEHGMPPMSGWGMGIERIIALLTEQDNLRDVVLFPLLRPETSSDID